MCVVRHQLGDVSSLEVPESATESTTGVWPVPVGLSSLEAAGSTAACISFESLMRGTIRLPLS
jgi:hypothetical protein